MGVAEEEVERHFKARVEGATCAARAPAVLPAEVVAEVGVEEEVVVAVAAVVVAVVVVAGGEWAGRAVNPGDENGFLIHNCSRFRQR